MTKTQIKHAVIIAELSIVDAQLGSSGVPPEDAEREMILERLHKRVKRRLMRGYNLPCGLGLEDIIKKVKEFYPEVTP